MLVTTTYDYNLNQNMSSQNMLKLWKSLKLTTVEVVDAASIKPEHVAKAPEAVAAIYPCCWMMSLGDCVLPCQYIRDYNHLIWESHS